MQYSSNMLVRNLRKKSITVYTKYDIFAITVLVGGWHRGAGAAHRGHEPRADEPGI